MELFINVLKEDTSLTATFYAGEHFVHAASDSNLKWNPFYTKPLIEWWENNSKNVKQ